MQNFDSFENIFTFFVQSFYNKDYVEKIDQSVSNDTIDEETKLMIEQVKAFHTMRHEMCTKIFDYLSNNKLLHMLVTARGLEQFDVVPNGSICFISGRKLNANQGILLYINNQKSDCVTVHKRFKRILYNFWYLVHFSDEIMIDIELWLSKQTIEKNEQMVSVILTHQNKLFIKKGYVKLKNLNEYIQTEMTKLPINRANTTVR
jgi:hypothetical protein|tara:strand:- start:1695 stop:2306 length:612 start_codon:yes stop_codon:yes gene_type:complete